jgi:hypothetical protein
MKVIHLKDVAYARKSIIMDVLREDYTSVLA